MTSYTKGNKTTHLVTRGNPGRLRFGLVDNIEVNQRRAGLNLMDDRQTISIYIQPPSSTQPGNFPVSR